MEVHDMYGYGCGGWLPPIAPLTIPGIYSDTLSYEDNLAQIMMKMNELIEQINTLSRHTNEYTDEQIKTLKKLLENELQGLDTKIDNLKVELEEKIFKSYEKSHKELQEHILLFDQFKKEVALKWIEIDTRFIALKNYADSRISKALKDSFEYSDKTTAKETIEREASDIALSERISNIVKEFPPVYNAVLGLTSNVQDTFNSFYKYLRELAILSINYDKLELTAEEYDGLEMQAHVFDVYSGFIFADELQKIFSPFTGKKENTSKVLYDLIGRIRWNADTASYFDEHASIVKDYETKPIKSNSYEVENIRGLSHDNNYLQRKYRNTAVVWYKGDDNTTQGWFNNGWSSFTNKNDAEIESFTLVFGRNGKKEEKTILYDAQAGGKISFDLTDFSVTNEKQVAYTRLVTIGYHDATSAGSPLNTFNIGDCVANSLSYENLSHETYVSNDNLVVYELRVNYTSGSYIEL